MNYTGYISMVKTNISGCCNSEFQISQTSVFLNFLKTVPNGKWSLKVHKNQCFMNEQVLCGKCQSLKTEGTGWTKLGKLYG